jgi:penicillin-binding protein 1A
MRRRFARMAIKNSSTIRFYVYSAVMAVAIVAGSVSLRRLVTDLPPITSLEEYTPSLTTRIFDRNGELIGELFTERRELLSLQKIPVDLQNAVIAVEDDDFFHHWGIAPKGIVRAALRNFFAGRVMQGGSTITQQLSKLIFLTQERTLSRKIREILLALQIERNFSKQEILQLYLNQVYLGHGAYGVQSAAMVYFGKQVSDLTLGECAMLAGLIRAPSGYSPFKFPDKARQRRSVVLARMQEEGYVTSDERQKALLEPIPEARPMLQTTQAPYFVEQVRQELEPRYGFNALWKGGMEIHTSLDLSWQKVAEQVMEEKLSAYDARVAKEGHSHSLESEDVEASTATLPIQGAFVLVDVKSGAVRVLVGGRDFKNSQFNRAVQAQRQPGSAFKPFVWATALETGLTPATTIADEPLEYYYDGRDWKLFDATTSQYLVDFATAPFAVNEQFKIWVPSNFDSKFLGSQTLRRGLELSRNLVSIRIVEKVGPTAVVELAHRMGIESKLSPVLSLGLGTSVVSPLELASAYADFANGGTHVEPYFVTRVLDHGGRVLEEHVPTETAAISPQIAYVMTSMLKGVVEHGTGLYVKRLARPIAGKTGTTQENRDLWFVGFTPDVSAAAWMGYDDFTSLGGRSWTGGGAVAPWWTDIMKEILKSYPIHDFSVPDAIVFKKIDSETGMLALPSCPKQRLETFIKGTEPTAYCDVDHYAAAEAAAEAQKAKEEAEDIALPSQDEGPVQPAAEPEEPDTPDVSNPTAPPDVVEPSISTGTPQ